MAIKIKHTIKFDLNHATAHLNEHIVKEIEKVENEKNVNPGNPSCGAKA